MSPSDASACIGDDAEFSVSIKNTGSMGGTFELTSTFGELESDSVILEGGRSETIMLDVDTSGMPEGDVIIGVTASDGPVTDTASAELEVENCYDAELTLQPDDVTVCPGASVPYTIKVKNTGKQAD